MAVTFGFYNSLNHDRQYNSVQLSSIFDGIINDGIFFSLGTHMVVTPSSDMNISVGSGRAWFNHTWTDNDAAIILAVDPASSTPDIDRIDIVVLEVNASDDVRANSVKIIKGTPGTTPVAPTLTNAGNVHQYALAHISVPYGLTAITAGEITNKIGVTEGTPYITGPLETLNNEEVVAQWESQFTTWFNEMKDQLTTDAAGNLQSQINNLQSPINNLQSQINNLPKVIARQGGSPTDWNLSGNTNYTPSNAKIQVGNAELVGEVGQFVVTFPIPFSAKPIVLLTPDPGINSWLSAQILSVSATGFTGLAIRHNPIEEPLHNFALHLSTINWFAIGPINP